MKFFLIGLAIGILFLSALFRLDLSFRVDQPIPLNHEKRQEQGVECITCHSPFKKQLVQLIDILKYDTIAKEMEISMEDI
jgi:hypothetical protein